MRLRTIGSYRKEGLSVYLKKDRYESKWGYRQHILLPAESVLKCLKVGISEGEMRISQMSDKCHKLKHTVYVGMPTMIHTMFYNLVSDLNMNFPIFPLVLMPLLVSDDKRFELQGVAN